MGDEAGRNSIGQHNSYMGQNAARWRTGSSNVALGSNALVGISNSQNSTGSSNTAIGTAAGTRLEGDGNALLGAFSGSNLRGNDNIVSGSSAGSSLNGSYNIVSGYLAGIAATGDDNVFIGRQTGIGATLNRGVAVGAYSRVSKDNAVVLGSYSNSDGNATTEASAILNGLTYGDFAGQVMDTGMQVSVGSLGAERQIKNVGAGAINDTSTDAINGSQLYATNAVLGNVGNSLTNIFGGNATLNQNGSMSYTNIGGTGKNTIDEAIQASRTTVSQGNNIIVNASSGTDGHINYEVATSPNLTADSLTINNGGPVISQTGIDMNNNKIINIAVGTADTDAVNVGQLKQVNETANKGWNLTTNGENASTSNVKAGDTVDFIGDGNVVVSNIGNNISIGLADAITVGSGSNAVTIDGENGKFSVGNTSITSDGLSIVGGPSITKNGIDAGNQTIVNVGSGFKDATGNTTELNNAVESNGVNVGDLKQVVNNLSTNVAAAKTEVVAGKNMVVSSNVGADGQTIYTVATNSKVDFDQLTVGSVNLDKSNIDADGNTKISGVGKGDLNASSTDVVNGSQLYETNQQVAKNTNNIATNTTHIAQNTAAINKGLNFSADSGSAINRQLGDTVAIIGDANIKTETTNNGVKVSLANDLNVNSISSKDVKVSENLTINNGANIDMGNNVVHNVAAGTADTDAVNVGQLNSSMSTVNHKIDYMNRRLDDVDNNARAGIAQAIATAGLPQAYIPGKNMMAISGGTYRGESAYAIGLSSISDNGKWVFKMSGSGNSQGDFGGSVGAGIQW